MLSSLIQQLENIIPFEKLVKKNNNKRGKNINKGVMRCAI